MAIAMIGMSSVAHAHHDGYYWSERYRARGSNYYWRELYSAKGNNRDQRVTRPGNNSSPSEANAADRAKSGVPDTIPAILKKNPSVVQVNGFGVAIGQIIGACREQAAEFKKASFEGRTRIIQPSEAQSDALDRIRATVTDAADTLAVTCPKDIPAPLSEKVGTLSFALDVIVGSLTTLRPAFVTFFDLLDDEQKARLIVDSQSKSDNGSPFVRTEHTLNEGIALVEDTVCNQFVAALRSWPNGQIENGITLTDEQHAASLEVAAAAYRAAGRLVTPCRAEHGLTPVRRLDSERETLEALRQGLDEVRFFLAEFENRLTDEQKKWFDATPAIAEPWPAPAAVRPHTAAPPETPVAAKPAPAVAVPAEVKPARAAVAAPVGTSERAATGQGFHAARTKKPEDTHRIVSRDEFKSKLPPQFDRSARNRNAQLDAVASPPPPPGGGSCETRHSGTIIHSARCGF
jgi:hypothetical protein